MNNCPKCHTPVQPDARFCEACGWLLSKPWPSLESAAAASFASDGDAPTLTDPNAEAPAKAGSLKEHLAVLAGPLRQMRAKWPQRAKKAAGAATDATPKANRETIPTKRSTKIISIVVSLLTGLAVIAFWVWLLLRKTGAQLWRCFIK